MAWDWLKGIGGLASAFIPVVRQRMAERRAGIAPESVPVSADEELMDGALRRLGSIKINDSWWSSTIAELEANVLRPALFCTPAVREWLSLPQTRKDLTLATRAKLSRSEIPKVVINRLVNSYISIEATGEDHRHAEGAIKIAVAYLQASVQKSTRDIGSAALIQATALNTVEAFKYEIATLSEAVGASKNPYVAPKFSEEAQQDLRKILRRRATPGQDTAGDLRKLLSDFDDGHRLALADPAIRQEAQYWLARVEAGKGHSEVAEKILTELAAMRFDVPEVAWALVEHGKAQSDLALKRLRDLRDMDSQSVIFHILFKTKGALTALAYVDELKPLVASAFTPNGWNNYCATLITFGQVDEATDYLEMLLPDVAKQCTHLHYMHAVSCLLKMVSPDRQKSVMQEGYFSVLRNLLDGPDADQIRQKALSAAEKAHSCALEAEDHIIANWCENGIRILRLLDPLTRNEEVAAIKARMEDGASAVKLIWLVRAHNIEFDAEPMERYLAHCKRIGGLTSDQLRAELLLLDHPERTADLRKFLEEQWSVLKLDNDVEKLTVKRVETYAALKDFDAATAFLETQRSIIDVSIWYRLDLMLRNARGEDASSEALQLYKDSSSIIDLWNLVRVLGAGKHWQRLRPFSEELFRREPTFETAMLCLDCLRQTRASAFVVNEFLNGTVGVVNQKPEIRSARAWALLELGNHVEAKLLNDKLLVERSEGVDIALDIRIATRTGDWERFPIIIAKALEMHSQLHSQMLLSLAKLVEFTDLSQAVTIAQEAVVQDSNSIPVLVGAYMVAIAAGRDDIAMPWMHKAMELSKEQDSGIIRTYSYGDLAELMRSNAENWNQKNEMYRTGQVPIHMAASLFNAPLVQMLIGIPRRNESEVEVRRRQPVPIRSGKRRPVSAEGFRRIALDITTIIVLNELKRLKDVFQLFDEIYISPRVMESMLSDRGRIAFHQPSRIVEVKPLMMLLTAGRIRVVKAAGDLVMNKEVGEEIASLLKAAKSQEGKFVHPGLLYKEGSFLKDRAELGELSSLVADPIDVADALLGESRINESVYCDGVDYLRRTGSVSRNSIARGVPLFLDGLSIKYLQQAGLIQPLVNSGHKISVHQSTVDEWQALLETEPQAEDLKGALNDLRLNVRDGLMSGKVLLLKQSRRQEDLDEIAVLPILDLLDDILPAEAAVVDDRMFAENSFLSDSNGTNVPLLSSLDILDALVARGSMSSIDFRNALHILRARCYFCIPLPPADLLSYIEAAEIHEGQMRETAELRVIREYLARLHSTDVLCTAGDFEYLDSIWSCGTYVAVKLWADEKLPTTETAVKANWVVENIIPDIELVMRFDESGSNRMRSIAVSRSGVNLFGVNSSAERQQAQAKWFEESYLSRFFPANSDLVDQIAEQAADAIIVRTQEIENEFERRNSSAAT